MISEGVNRPWGGALIPELGGERWKESERGGIYLARGWDRGGTRSSELWGSQFFLDFSLRTKSFPEFLMSRVLPLFKGLEKGKARTSGLKAPPPPHPRPRQRQPIGQCELANCEPVKNDEILRILAREWLWEREELG